MPMLDPQFVTYRGQTPNIDVVNLSPAAPVTATANGTAVLLGDRGTVRLLLDVTAENDAATAETLDVSIQTSFDNVTWRAVAAFTQATGVTSERKSFTGIDRYIRAVYTIGGTGGPSFTFTIKGEAV